MASADVVTAKARAAKAINLSVVIVNLLEAEAPQPQCWGLGRTPSRVAGREYRH